MSEKMPTHNGKEEAPPPYYAGDRGWSKERESKMNEITKIVDQDNFANRERSKKTLDALRALIQETEDAVRNNPDTRAGMTWIEQSRLIQGLLYDWYQATKGRTIE